MKLAIFDFDGTLLQKDTLPCLAGAWLRQGRSRIRAWSVTVSVLPVVLAYKMKLVSRETMKGQAFKRFNRLFTGLSRWEIEEFFQQAYPELRVHFNPAILDEIISARQEGFHCVLVSGSYLELLRLIASDLDMDTVLGAQLVFSGEVFDPSRETPFVDGQAKRLMLLETFAGQSVDWESSRAYGDSLTDIFIMETVGEKIAVKPDFQLAAHAHRHGWRIIV